MRMLTTGMVLLLAACANGGQEHQPSSGQAGPGELRLMAELGRDRLSAGEELVVRLTVSNPGPEAISRRFNSGCIYGFALIDDQGEAVAPPPPICTMNVPTISWAAGEEVVQEFRWRWEAGDPPAGNYRVRAGLGPRGELAHAPLVPVELR